MSAIMHADRASAGHAGRDRTNLGLVSRPFASPLGLLTLVASQNGLLAVLWPDRAGLGPIGELGPCIGANLHLCAAADQLDAYFACRRRRFELALDLRGTSFQLGVWAALAAIPYGETRTYGDIAAAIGRPGASRAVGAANGRNPLSIIVPCHRVIGSDGGLTGFAGGLEAKRRLLSLECSEGALL